MTLGTSLALQGLRLCAPTAGGAGLIPGQGAKIPYALWHSKTNQRKRLFHSASSKNLPGLTQGYCHLQTPKFPVCRILPPRSNFKHTCHPWTTCHCLRLINVLLALSDFNRPPGLHN